MSRDIMDIAKRLRIRAENAYNAYISLCRASECLGWEIKVLSGKFVKASSGKFGEAELKAHKEAAEMLGRYRALLEIAAYLEENADA